MVLPSTQTVTPCEPALARHWELAVQNPTCITHDIFCAMLKHRPPLCVVQSVLTLNRNVAICPPNESTPALHVAVKNNCELSVVACLLEAWPEALQRKAPCGRNQLRMDPLMYVKLYRRRDSDLIQLLSTANNSWYRNNGSVTLKELCQSSSQYATLKENSFETSNLVTGKSIETATNHSGNSSTSVVLDPVKLFTAEVSDSDDSSDFLNDGESRLGAKPAYSPPAITVASDKKNVSDQRQQTIHASMSYEQEIADLRATCMVVLKGHQRLVERIKKLEDRVILESCHFHSVEGMETWCSELMTTIEMQIHHQLSEQSRSLELIVERLEENVSNSHKESRSQLQFVHTRLKQTESMLIYMQQHGEERFRDLQRKPQQHMYMPKSILVREVDDDALPLLHEDDSPGIGMYKKYHQLGSKPSIAKKVRFLICQS